MWTSSHQVLQLQFVVYKGLQGEKDWKYKTEVLEKIKNIIDSQNVDSVNLSEDGLGLTIADFLREIEIILQKDFIKEVIFEEEDLKPEHAKELAERMRNNKSLTSLNLSMNLLGDQGVQFIAEVLNTTALKTLDISTNMIGDKGMRAIALALMDNKTLTSLNLDMNKIGDEGAVMMASALQKNTTLKYLNLSENYLTKEGVAILEPFKRIDIDLENQQNADSDMSESDMSESDHMSFKEDFHEAE